ncbi:hypothetical protein EWI61_12165 [Methylolobus aquaticus]|nr:hypothetical protein EWI61_12165 [Methylolobus aquaticus]
MLISTQYKFAFLCMPKAASTSVDSALRPYSEIITRGRYKHMNYRQFERFFLPLLRARGKARAIETLCIVREPIGRLESWYRYRSRLDPNGSGPLGKHSTRDITFDQFVEAYLSSAPPEFARIGRQCDFVFNKRGKVGVKRLFALENMERLAAFLETLLGQSISIPILNKSPALPINLSPDLTQRLRKALAEDYALYSRALEA